MSKRADKVFINNQFRPFSAKNAKQKSLFSALNVYDIVFAKGAAGTGKTAVITSYAAQKLYEGHIDKIIVTRPAITACGESLGYLPGDLINDKFMPYLQPLEGIFSEVLGKSHYESYVRNGKIVPVPLGFMRGRTFKDAIIIADEIQGTTPEQMEMLTTRIGENCKLFCAGDEEQSDIKGVNGLTIAVKYLSWMDECAVIEFDLDDTVRSHLTSDIIKSFRRYKHDS